MSEENKVLGTEWCGGVIGFVAVSTFDGWKVFCGIGEGRDEHIDVQHIKDFGTKIKKSWAIAIFPHLEAGEYEE